ncbi:MAG: molybdopterin-guanine dinucleotide biosynthesis protein B [Dethiobacteria bacterium]
MIPIFSIVGHSKTGKTTYIRKLIKELRLKGYKVAVIKHDPLDHGDVDRAGSDTSYFFEEGSSAVVLSSPSRLSIFRRMDKDTPPEKIVPLCGDIDCAILEGYKRWDYPKIEIWSRIKGKLEINPKQLLAIVFDQEEDREALMDIVPKALPVLLKDDLEGMISLLEDSILRKGGEQ